LLEVWRKWKIKQSVKAWQQNEETISVEERVVPLLNAAAKSERKRTQIKKLFSNFRSFVTYET
jgi:hypothetical protein